MEKLNESIEKSFIREEARLTKEHNKTAMQQESETTVKGARGGPSTGAIRKTRSGAAVKKGRPKKSEWSSTTAAEIEEGAMKEFAATESAKKSGSRTSFKRPKGRAKSPHFSPIKTPPQKQPPKQVGLYNYSNFWGFLACFNDNMRTSASLI